MNSVCISVLGCALGLSALASPDAPIPLDQLGAVAGRQYQGDGLAVSATPDGAQLRCVFQRLTGRVTPEGLWLESTEAGDGQLHLRATAIGREHLERSADIPVGFNLLPDEVTFAATDAWQSQAGWKPALPPTGTVSVQDGRVQFRRPGLVEEYSVSMDGVRQDFVVLERPLGQPLTPSLSPSDGERVAGRPGEGMLRVELELTGAEAEALPNGVRLTLDGSGRELAYSRLRVTDATGKELPARMEVQTHSAFRVPHSAFGLAVLVDDSEAVYPVRIDPTFSDADWVSLNPEIAGADGDIEAIAVDANGHVYIGGKFSFVGTVAANSIAKWDGSSWSALGSGLTRPPYNARVYALAVSGTNLFVGGEFSTAGGVAATNIAKWNGSTWSALGSGLNREVYALAVSGNLLYAGGNFTTAGGLAISYIARWNGSSWSALGSGVNSTVLALAVSGTTLYAGGGFTTAGGMSAKCIARWNGSTWSALGSGMSAEVRALAVVGTNLYAGGGFSEPAYRIAKWDGSSWSALGFGLGGDSSVHALAAVGTDLYVSGGLPNVGNIAKWDGNSWSALGSGLGGGVVALAASGNTLYAGGYFTTAGGVPASRIAKWQDNSWSALGSSVFGINEIVFALAVSGTNLYAGGAFTTAGGVAANRIARWNGSSWSALGSGMDDAVHALAVIGNNLYAGGTFSRAGGVVANCIARWNGSSWFALGSGMGYSGSARTNVFALAASGSTLYAGGFFRTAGGVAATNIARWNGSTWSAMGSGLNSTVASLAASGNTVYAGTEGSIAAWNGSAWTTMPVAGYEYGWFNALAIVGTDLYAGGLFLNYSVRPEIRRCVIKWDGSTWSSLGSDLSRMDGHEVNALAAVGTNLYVTGRFISIGGVLATNIAKWDGSTWSALGTGISRSNGRIRPNYYRPGEQSAPRVYALAADDAGHLYAGGDFCNAGDKPSPFLAQANLVPPLRIEGIRVDAGVVTLNCRGAAGGVCAVQRATDVIFTQNLTTLHTTNAPPDGRFTCTDASPPATAAFYRLRQP